MTYFVLSVVLFLSHQWAQVTGRHVAFLDAYLDPFLFFPLVLFTIKKWNQCYNPSFRITLLPALLTLSLSTVLFEVCFPKWSVHFTSDYLDAIAFTLGLVFYMVFMNTKKEKTLNEK